MVKKEKKSFGQSLKPRPAAPTVAKQPVMDICPDCGLDGDVIGGKCRKCGARKTVNSVSRNVIWIRNGRLVCAFCDAKQAFVKMAERYNLPKSRWPKEFLG